MQKFASIIACIIITLSSYAQERVTWKKRTEKLEHDTVLYHVNEYPAQFGILSLFMPKEIIMKRKLDPEVSQRIIDYRVQVLDSNHLVLKYFKYNASLQIGRKLIKPNEMIKPFNPAWVSGLRYWETVNHENDILEVQLYGEEYRPRENIIHKSQPTRIQFYDVDGKLITGAQLPDLRLGKEMEMGTIMYGKEAAEKYGDPKYAVGVQQMKTKKKP